MITDLYKVYDIINKLKEIFDNFIDMNNDISIYQLNNMTNNKFSINIYTNDIIN